MFDELGGYDEASWIGEDVDFYWAMKKHAKRTRGNVRMIRHLRVQASSRRFDRWPIWRTLLWSNPLFIALFRNKEERLGRLVLNTCPVTVSRLAGV